MQSTDQPHRIIGEFCAAVLVMGLFLFSGQRRGELLTGATSNSTLPSRDFVAAIDVSAYAPSLFHV
jgi:hypothetical protein